MFQKQGNKVAFKGQSYSGSMDCSGATEIICDFGTSNPSYQPIVSLANQFKNIQNVEIASLKFWNMSAPHQFLNLFFSQMPNLKNLSISVWSCTLQDEGLRAVMEVIANLQGLTSLYIDIRWNNVKDLGFVSFAKAIEQLTKLETLQIDASNNLITHKSMTDFGTAISKLQELKNFDLIFESNEMLSVGIQYLAEGVRHCKKLTDISLNFRNNKISNNENLRKACHVLSKCSQFVNTKFDFLLRRTYYYRNKQDTNPNLYKNELLKLQRTVLLDFETMKADNY